jgi:hypothetical protein
MQVVFKIMPSRYFFVVIFFKKSSVFLKQRNRIKTSKKNLSKSLFFILCFFVLKSLTKLHIFYFTAKFFF